MHPSPNISRSSVIGGVGKYELRKKGMIKEFASEIEVIYDIYDISHSKDRGKTFKMWSMTKKKRSSEILGTKMRIFS